MKNKEDFVFCPLGGSGEIGMNMNLFAYGNIENNGKWQNQLPTFDMFDISKVLFDV